MRSKRQLWQLVTEHFDRLIDLPADQRESELSVLAGQDPDLAAKIMQMLEADQDNDTLLQGGSAISVPGAAQALVEQLVPGHEQTDPWPKLSADARRRIEPPERIGPYRLVERLGIGGMGEVWLGERVDGAFEQQVAIKLVAYPGRGLAERFDLERRILARLQHPGIAHLYDGGQTPTGLPYLVMEYVEGLPITEHVAQARPALEPLLRLVIEICEAVDHAHRLMIVHRDLKPSNVLVDRNGQVKLLDFGIAKLLDDNNNPVLTLGEGQPMTPLYAAPEQVRGEPVSAATDVYALGAIFYELLTGHLPTAREGVPLTTLAEVVSRESIVPPSRSLKRSSTSGTWSASALRGDLDLVVVTALHHDPQRRYRSAAALADDLERLLRGLPIRARADSWRYRVGKFVRRHRYAAIAVVLAIFSLVLGFTAALWQADKAREAARQTRLALEQSERSKQFLVDLFGEANPLVSRHGSELSVQQLLLDAAQRLQTELADSAGAQAELRIAIGTSLNEIGESAPALPLLQAGLAQLRELHGEQSVQVANAWSQLGRALETNGDREAAEQAQRTALLLYQELPGDQRELTISVRTSLAKLAGLRGDSVTALALHQSILEDRMALLGPDDADLAVDYNNTAAQLVMLGRHAEAEPAYARAYALLEAKFGADHPRLAYVLIGQAACARQLGRLRQAQELAERGIVLADAALAPGHVLHGTIRMALARTLLDLDQPTVAEPLLRRVVQNFLDSRHPYAGRAVLRLGLSLAAQQRWSELAEVVQLSAAVEPLPQELRNANAGLNACLAYAEGQPGGLQALQGVLQDYASDGARSAQDRAELLECAWLAARHGDRSSVAEWRDALLLSLGESMPAEHPLVVRVTGIGR